MKLYCHILLFSFAATSALLNAQQTTFAVIGDFGSGDPDETAVANQLKSWNPQFVITTGDNRYSDYNYDLTIGRDYCDFLAGAEAGVYCGGNSSALNAFFPSIGNHDYSEAGGVNEYIAYFDLPGAGIQSSGTSGSELYYDFVVNQIHFFVIDSHSALSLGTMTTQQNWLQNQMAASTARWKIVYFHHPSYSSAETHGSTPGMQWPFAQWGADAVINGHDHLYERLSYDGIVYFVNGLGGRSKRSFADPLPGSIVRYSAEFGAQNVVADDTSLTFYFINIYGDTIDEYAIIKEGPPNLEPVFSSDTISETAATEDADYLNAIRGYATDPDGDSLYYSILSGPAWLSVTPEGDLSGTPLNEDVGLNSWIVVVEDGDSGADSATLQIVVLNTNDHPVFTVDTISETAATEDSVYINSIIGYATDPDGDSLYYSILSGPAWLSVTPDGDLSGTPLNENVGLNSWIVVVEDGDSGADSVTLQIMVINTNDSPVFASDTISETAATMDSVYINSIIGYATDPDGDSLYYSILSGPAWLSVAPDGDLSGTPLHEDVGLNSWMVKVEDGVSGADSATLQIVVFSSNQDTATTGYSVFESDTNKENPQTLFIVYPNPVSNRLIIQNEGWEGKKILTLYNMIGKAVYQGSMTEDRMEIDVTFFPEGIYILEISNGKLNETKEIIIH